MELSGASRAAVSASTDNFGVPVIAISGELDLASVESARSGIEEILVNPREVILDLAGLTFMDSSGIALLIQVNNRVESVSVINVRPAVHRVLEATGLLETFGLSR